MSIEYRVGDIFEQKDINVIAHQANLFHTFGAGIAAIIKDKYPEAYEADLKTKFGDENKLGTFSHALCKKDGRLIVNVYSQTGIGGPERNTQYDLIVKAFNKIEPSLGIFNSQHLKKKKVLGLPYGYGCGLASGSWTIVSAIFQSIFDKSSVQVVICRLSNQPELK